MAKVAPVVELTPEHVSAIQAWNEAEQALAAAKTNELAARLNVIKTVPFNADKEEGGQTLKLNAGWKLALNKPINYSADKDVQVVSAGLNALGASNPGAAAELVRWEAIISTGAYKKLTDSEKTIVASFISIKPGTPSLALTPPPVVKA